MNKPDDIPQDFSRLSPDDARVLDALIESLSRGQHGKSHGLRLTTQQLSPDDAARAEKIGQWLSLIGQAPVEPPPADLVARTMERVNDARRKEWFAEQSQALAAPRVGMRWGELAAIAAVLVIGVSVLFPALGKVRSDARRIACSENLSAAGVALGRYAQDHQQVLPRRGTWPGEVWWNVGEGRQNENQPLRSNSAHLYTLVRGGYSTPEGLACPENPHGVKNLTRDMDDWQRADQVSYSYQNQFTPTPMRIDKSPKMAVMADKNPLFVPSLNLQSQRGAPRITFRSDVSPGAPSAAHKGRGQNILMLHGGSVWSADPVDANGDNIWTLRGVKKYNGTEAPKAVDDAHLTP